MSGPGACCSCHCSVFKYTVFILPLPFPFWDVKNMCSSGLTQSSSSKIEMSIISIFGSLRERHLPISITSAFLYTYTLRRCDS